MHPDRLVDDCPDTPVRNKPMLQGIVSSQGKADIHPNYYAMVGMLTFFSSARVSSQVAPALRGS
jgi:hypothetical protein